MRATPYPFPPHSTPILKSHVSPCPSMCPYEPISPHMSPNPLVFFFFFILVFKMGHLLNLLSFMIYYNLFLKILNNVKTEWSNIQLLDLLQKSTKGWSNACNHFLSQLQKWKIHGMMMVGRRWISLFFREPCMSSKKGQNNGPTLKRFSRAEQGGPNINDKGASLAADGITDKEKGTPPRPHQIQTGALGARKVLTSGLGCLQDGPSSSVFALNPSSAPLKPHDSSTIIVVEHTP